MARAGGGEENTKRSAALEIVMSANGGRGFSALVIFWRPRWWRGGAERAAREGGKKGGVERKSRDE
jgi:hypothetical protein